MLWSASEEARSTSASKPTVYVYPLPPSLTGESLYDNITENDHDFHFKGELELTRRLRAMPQADPSTATMLLVPFMLVQAFTKLRKGFRSPGHAQLMKWDSDVIAYMRSVGPWWDTRRADHAVFAQRCAGPPSDRLRKASIAVHTWPTLWESNATLLCFEPATLTHMGRGILLPYGVGHGANNLRCPAGAEASTAAAQVPPPSQPRPSLLMFAGSVATNPARRAWVNAMQRQGEPTCKLVLFTAQARKHFSASDIEAALRTASFTLQLRGHVGPRKAIFDSIRCGALPLIASDRSPLPFADEIDYSKFGVRVGESANASKVLKELVHKFDAACPQGQ